MLALYNGGYQISGEVTTECKPVRIPIVSVLPKKYVVQNSVTPKLPVLQMWNKTRMVLVGQIQVELQNPANKNLYTMYFIVVEDDSSFAPMI